MGFIDDAVSAAKTVGRTVGKKTEEILIISKKKLEAIELENKLSNCYEELGKLCFSNLCGRDDIGESTMEQEELILNITKTIADLKELRAEIEVLSKNR